MPRTPKLILRTVLALFLGSVTAIVVCWGLAAWMPHSGWRQDTYSTVDEDGPVTAYVEELRAFGCARRKWSIWGTGWKGEWAADPINDPIAPSPGYPEDEHNFLARFPRWGQTPGVLLDPSHARSFGCEHACGWPVLCAAYQITPDYTAGRAFKVEHGITLAVPPPITRAVVLSGIRVLPLSPIWWGLFVDILFYAACWATLLLALGSIRRRFRRRRGLCTACKYDRAGLPAGSACPECGTAPVLTTA